MPPAVSESAIASQPPFPLLAAGSNCATRMSLCVPANSVQATKGWPAASIASVGRRDAPIVPREKMEEIFQDLQADLRFDHELNGCLNCGICTATCPAAHYYDFSPREIVQLLWTENLEGIYDAMQEKIWACAQCYTCAAPVTSSPPRGPTVAWSPPCRRPQTLLAGDGRLWCATPSAESS